jgi:endoglucanase
VPAQETAMPSNPLVHPIARCLTAASLAAAFGLVPITAAASAYLRIDQLGYPIHTTARAYLMATALETGATFKLLDSTGATIASGNVPSTSKLWHTFHVYALDFTASRSGSFTLAVSGPDPATSPSFRVATPATLYAKALANGLSFFQNQRDGAGFIASPLRSAPGHLHDATAGVYRTPTFDSNDNVVGSLSATGATVDASGGWVDAGDYLKFVQTTSYAEAMMLSGVRDFPTQLGPGAPADFSAESQFGVDWLLRMWDDTSKTLYYQTGIASVNANTFGDHDLWRLPQADDTFGGSDATYRYIRNRPVFLAGVAGSKISPNLAGRLAADFGLCYQVFHASNAALANQCLLAGEHVFDLANTAPTGNLMTAAPFDFYPETEWRDDLEWGATELFFALRAGGSSLPGGLPHTDPTFYLQKAATWAHAYITGPNDGADSLNLYDVSGIAHFDLYRAIGVAGSPAGLAVTQAQLLADLQQQLASAETVAASDPFAFGWNWADGDTAAHGSGLAVTAAEVAYLTQAASAKTDASHWGGNILGANAWGVSLIVGDGKTFPKCPQHQVANLAGHLNGSQPVLNGAVVEGPNSAASTGALDGMRACPVGGGDVYAAFNGKGAVFRDNVQSFTTVEPAIDLTVPSLLMFGWKVAGTVQQIP